MTYMLRGALVEYGSSFLGPIPNVVVFQFNPEQLTRTINIPPRPDRAARSGARTGERAQASAPPIESFTITAHFSAADNLGRGGAAAVIPRTFGVGPQLAALEKMVYPSNGPGALVGAVIDAVGDLLGDGDEQSATRSMPREQLPRILFIWGLSRVLPVEITSLKITEQKFDFLLNPVQAQVDIGMDIPSDLSGSGDDIGEGALKYSQTMKDTQSALNLAEAARLAIEIIPI